MGKRLKPEEIIAKLREVEVRLAPTARITQASLTRPTTDARDFCNASKADITEQENT